MSCPTKFYRCDVCGNMVSMVIESGVVMNCCNQPMTLLNANTTDAATEKHVPAITVNGDTVEVAVGSVAHPMLEEHYIQWIYLETTGGSQIKCLKPGAAPKASFTLVPGEKAVAAYEYCNLHGLWKAQL